MPMPDEPAVSAISRWLKYLLSVYLLSWAKLVMEVAMSVAKMMFFTNFIPKVCVLIYILYGLNYVSDMYSFAKLQIN
jgi:hypothetical protein